MSRNIICEPLRYLRFYLIWACVHVDINNREHKLFRFYLKINTGLSHTRRAQRPLCWNVNLYNFARGRLWTLHLRDVPLLLFCRPEQCTHITGQLFELQSVTRNWRDAVAVETIASCKLITCNINSIRYDHKRKSIMEAIGIIYTTVSKR
jgi:hypothetical protein